MVVELLRAPVELRVWLVDRFFVGEDRTELVSGLVLNLIEIFEFVEDSIDRFVFFEGNRHRVAVFDTEVQLLHFEYNYEPVKQVTPTPSPIQSNHSKKYNLHRL